jgi:hypothetical protein
VPKRLSLCLMPRPQRGQAASRGQSAERRDQATADELEEHQRVQGPVLMAVWSLQCDPDAVPLTGKNFEGASQKPSLDSSIGVNTQYRVRGYPETSQHR